MLSTYRDKQTDRHLYLENSMELRQKTNVITIQNKSINYFCVDSRLEHRHEVVCMYFCKHLVFDYFLRNKICNKFSFEKNNSRCWFPTSHSVY